MVLVAEKLVANPSSWFNNPSPPAFNKPYLPTSAALTTTTTTNFVRHSIHTRSSSRRPVVMRADLSPKGGGVDDSVKKKVPSSNYVVPFDSSSCITRPLEEILRDLNKRVPDNIIIKPNSSSAIDGDGEGVDVLTSKPYIPWYHANRMLSFYAPGTGFQSKGSYLFGHFSMQIKMVPGDSAGTVTAFYLSAQNSEHDEIDFEFLGNRTGQPYILQTNVFTGGKGDREQRIFLWFDPTKNFHSYSILWNLYQIIFLVDNIPIRVFKNCKDLGVKFPFNQPMKIYSSLWNADDWATRGGLEKTNWAKAPFIASYRSFHVDGCESSVQAKFCATQGRRWWDQKEFQDLDPYQYRRLRWVRSKYTIYNYCTDRKRFPKMAPECKRDRDI